MGGAVSHGQSLAVAAEANVLLSRFSRAITAVAEEKLGRGAISNRDVEVLMVMRHGARSPSEIADEVGAVRASVSRTLRRLRAAGLVTTTTDAVDGRARQVALSRLAHGRMTAFAKELGHHIDKESALLEGIASRLGLAVVAVPVSGPPDALSRAEAMARAGGRYQHEAGARLERWQVSGTRPMHALAWLWSRGGERPARIAEELDLTSQATSVLIDHLVAKGLAERSRAEISGDQRAVIVSLTSDGEAAARALLEVFAQHAERLIESIIRPT